ncbi:MAG: hypothetical protein AAGJ28_03020, partial [Pseudomonadota bacterium]
AKGIGAHHRILRHILKVLLASGRIAGANFPNVVDPASACRVSDIADIAHAVIPIGRKPER